MIRKLSLFLLLIVVANTSYAKAICIGNDTDKGEPIQITPYRIHLHLKDVNSDWNWHSKSLNVGETDCYYAYYPIPRTVKVEVYATDKHGKRYYLRNCPTAAKSRWKTDSYGVTILVKGVQTDKPPPKLYCVGWR